jgi:uncharacterized protein YecE (DUF72 family)
VADRLLVGCSGWNYASWRGILYEKGLPTNRWLERYAESFDTVELNTSFYRLVKPHNAARWVEQTPPHFVFAAKASRYLTHMKRLAEAGKLGPVVWQLPPNFKRDDDRLAAALDLIDRLTPSPPALHSWEFRHPSWFAEEAPTLDLLRAFGAALVIGDRRGLDFQPHARTVDWTLVRFHYGHRGRRGNYSEAEVREWAERLRGQAGYAYFNNDWEGFAIGNARQLKRLMSAERSSA